VTTDCYETIGIGNDGQIRREKGQGKGRKKKQQKNVESSGDLIGSASAGKQKENAERLIIVAEATRLFRAAFEPFIARQGTFGEIGNH
jgi:hypothetical protein